MTEPRRWSREELLVVLNLYGKLRFGRFHSRQPVVVEVAEKMQRTPGSLAMKLSNLASLDPKLQARAVKNRVRLGMLHKWSSFPTRTRFLGNPVRSVQRARLGSSRSFPVTCASKGIACISCRGYAGASTDLAQKGT